MRNIRTIMVGLTTALTIAGAVITISCSKEKQPTTKAPPAQPVAPVARIPQVEIVTVGAATISEHVELPGNVRARSIANVLAPAEGRITKLTIREGDQVAANSVIAMISSQMRDDIINAARLTVEQLEHDLKTEHSAELEARLTQAQDDHRFAVEQYREIPVIAPASGILVGRYADMGDMVIARQKLFELQTGGALRIDVTVSEKDLGRLRRGVKAQVRADAYPDSSITAVIDRVHPKVDERTRTVLTELNVLSGNSILKAGMYTRVIFTTATADDAVVVPVTAVLTKGEKQVCYVFNENLAEERTVTTGIENSGRIEIKSGLSIGDKLVTSGHQQLRSGVQVQIRNSPQQKKPEGK